MLTVVLPALTQELTATPIGAMKQWAGSTQGGAIIFSIPKGGGTKSLQKQNTDKRQDDRRQQDERVLYHQANRIALIIKRSHDGAPP
jgi:hypothetical protein